MPLANEQVVTEKLVVRPRPPLGLGSALIGKDGMPIAWEHRLVSGSILQRVFPMAVRDGVDPTSIETAADLPYAIPNVKVDYHMVDADNRSILLA